LKTKDNRSEIPLDELVSEHEDEEVDSDNEDTEGSEDNYQ
jgi:hypothetical protein